MLSLVYISSAEYLFSTEELRDLLDRARAKNARLGITGMLLYKDGNFMQVLEGPPPEVDQLFATIMKDRRHRGSQPLLRETLAERQFPHWTMGFKNLNGVSPTEPGFSEILDQPFDAEWFRSNPSRAQKLLLSFRKNM